MRYFLVCLLFGLTSLVVAQDATATPIPTPKVRPVPSQVLPVSDGLSVERYFLEMSQGTVGLLRLVGANVIEAQALFHNHSYPFFRPEGDDAWYALVVADIDAQPRDYPLQILIGDTDGTLKTVETSVTITDAGYIRQVFTVPADRAYLINPEVERNEFARLDTLTTPITPMHLWDANYFKLPIEGDIVSAFGQYRILNSTVQTRHTGWDIRAGVGTPVGAMANGEVVFAGQLDIRGNYVLINHGWGVYTGYAHFSQLNVAVGQTVQQGQIIGMSGNTGRSNGPHLHWEVCVNGEWVDGQAFIAMWLP